MPFVILPTNSASGGYDITNSLRFNAGSSDNLSKVFSSAETSNKIGTLSFWFKTLGTNQQYLVATNTGTIFYIYFNSSTGITFQNGATTTRFTSQVFRDPSAWYHLVVAWDTTQGTSSNRQKMYLNGSEITAFSTSNDLSLNQVIPFFDNDGSTKHIGSYTGGGYYSGYISEFYGIDGQQLTPSSFGETDEDSGIWKPKAYTGSFGTNGFYLDFEDSANLGNDMSGNNNDFTVNNLTSIDQTTDTPTNNFCTLNPLNFGSGTLSEGNLKWTATASTGYLAFGTIGIDMSVSNKFYWETKIDSIGSGVVIGIAPTTLRWNDTGRSGSYGYYSDGNKYSGTTASAYGASFTTNDIIGILAGNGTLTFYKNGVSQGTAFSGLSGTYLPFLAEVSQTNSMNFGNPPFTISSSETDPSGFGNFEYSTNSGYALNTKNLASFG